MNFQVNGSERLRIDSSGNVGIGTTDPTVASGNGLAIYDSVVPRVQLRNSTSGDASTDGAGIFMSGSDLGIENRESSNIIFYNNTEKMRIDSSGNLLVGTTDTTWNSAEGLRYFNGDALIVTRTSDAPLFLNRLSTDGEILNFNKDGTTVGNIGTSTGYTKITSGDGINGSGLQFGDSKIYPVEANSVVTDNAVDFGDPSYRFKDLYLSGGAYLGGTGAANKLDDYEEGTWTPTISSGGWTMSTISKATYTKIGNRVVVQTFFDITGTGNGTDLVIGGLPFTCASNAYSASAADIDRNSLVGTYARVLANSSTIEFFTASGSTATSRTKLIGTSIGAGYIIFNVIYEAA
jgi:hypothetical protein